MKFLIVFLAVIVLVAIAKAQEDTTNEPDGYSQEIFDIFRPFQFPFPIRKPFFAFLNRRPFLYDFYRNYYLEDPSYTTAESVADE